MSAAVLLSPEELEALLERAAAKGAEEGVRRALGRVGDPKRGRRAQRPKLALSPRDLEDAARDLARRGVRTR